MSTQLNVDENVGELDRARARIAELERELARRGRAEEELRASEEKYRTLVESSPYCIKLMDGDGCLLSMNRAGLEMIHVESEQQIVGRHYLKVVSEQDLERVTALLDKALLGEPSEFDFLSSIGKYFRSNFVPIVGSDGRVDRMLSITQDITDRRRLVDELNHRVKNNLAAVLALSEQTRHTAQSLDQFTKTFDDRVRALARSHEALAKMHWEGVRLHDIVRLAVAPYMPLDQGRVHIAGDDVLLPARACGPLSLALHELTTNAAKYGAISTSAGRVDVVSELDEDDALRLGWTETGGPAPDAGAGSGVGMTLIRGFVEHELNGTLELELGATGLVGRMTIPLGDLRPSQSLDDVGRASGP